MCVVDDLEAAESALQTARALADRFNARIILVSVADAADAEGSDREDEERRIAGGDPAEAVARISMDIHRSQSASAGCARTTAAPRSGSRRNSHTAAKGR